MYKLSPDNTSGKNLFAHLITDGLHYCCVHFFLSRYASHENTKYISARLGVSEQCVRRHTADWKAGKYPCRNCANCMQTEKPE